MNDTVNEISHWATSTNPTGTEGGTSGIIKDSEAEADDALDSDEPAPSPAAPEEKPN